MVILQCYPYIKPLICGEMGAECCIAKDLETNYIGLPE
jgi:hypothetical protein